MKTRGLSGFTAALLALGIALTMAPASAEHCNEVLIFTGYNPDVLPANATTTGHYNAGATGCTNAAAHADTNYILPGALYFRIDVNDTASMVPTGQRYRLHDGTAWGEWIDFETAHTGSRWRGPVLELPEGTTSIQAEARVATTGEVERTTQVALV